MTGAHAQELLPSNKMTNSPVGVLEADVTASENTRNGPTHQVVTAPVLFVGAVLRGPLREA